MKFRTAAISGILCRSSRTHSKKRLLVQGIVWYVYSNHCKNEVEQSRKAPYRMEDFKEVPWNAARDRDDYKTPTTMRLPNLLDISKCCIPTSIGDNSKQTCSALPPPDGILVSLGLAPSNHASWWQEMAGLRSPAAWNVQGSVDTTAYIDLFKTFKTLDVSCRRTGVR